MSTVITALIPSKNRPDRVNRLIESIRRQKFCETLEIVVVDDGSSPPLELADRDVKLIRNQVSAGACAARNRAIAESSGELILALDDDTELHDPMTLRRAVELAREHPDFGAIGFQQLMGNGEPEECQPAHSEVPCETAYFFGYGVVLRRAAFLATNGFETSFGYYYEEQDLSLQLHEAGWRVMYAPELSLLHHHEPSGRDWTKIHRLLSRNAIRSMMLRFPIYCVLPCAAAKWISFFLETRRRGKTDWMGGFRLFFQTFAYVPSAVSRRDPLALKTLARYRRLKKSPVPLASASVNEPDPSGLLIPAYPST